ncbi:hypothetical protein BH20ACT2_BH20ACT2_15260 [soil metagenome]
MSIFARTLSTLVVLAALTAVAAVTFVVHAPAGENMTGGAGPLTTTAPDVPSDTSPPDPPPPTVPADPPPDAVPSTTTTSSPERAPAPKPLPDPSLREGDRSPEVQDLQERLTELGFWLGEPDGTYGRLTSHAVMAFQKSAGLARDGIAGPATLAALEGGGRPEPRSTADGIEIDLDRQLLLVVAGGEVRWTFNTSTGRSGWRTPRGEFTVQRAIDGVRQAPLGDLYRPRYFNGGIALHGSASIPGHPASHGCARLSNAATDLLWSSDAASIGTAVRVY